MRIKSSESEVLAMVKAGQIELTASIQVDGFRARAASQLPSVGAWIAAQIPDFTPLSSENFRSVEPVIWYLKRNGEVYGPLSNQAVLRLGPLMLAGDEIFSVQARAYFTPVAATSQKIVHSEKVAA